MNLEMGNQQFINVEIPLLWGNRAILQSNNGQISILLLEKDKTILEILDNKPAPNIQYELTEEGFKIVKNKKDIYSFDSKNKIISGLSSSLPECEINDTYIRIGTNIFSGNTVSGFGVGIFVDEQGGIGMGVPLPAELAKLVL